MGRRGFEPVAPFFIFRSPQAPLSVDGDVVATLYLLPSPTPAAGGTAVIVSAAPALSLPSPLPLGVTGLGAGATYSFRVACSNAEDAMGPVVPTSPDRVTPQPPVITSITTSAPLLSTVGGHTIDVTGTQVREGGWCSFAHGTCDCVGVVVTVSVCVDVHRESTL